VANPTTNYNFVLPTPTDLVTDLPADFDVALQGVDTQLKALQPGTTLGDIAYSSATANTNTRLGVGTTGQVLTVAAGVPSWATPTAGMTNPMTTTGDTIYSSSGSTPARLGIGSTGQILTVAGGVPTWAAPPTGGKVLQVVTATNSTEKNTTSGTYADSNLTVTITPTLATSKVLVMVTQAAGTYSTGAAQERNNYIQLLRSGTVIRDAVYPLRMNGSTSTSGNEITDMFPLIILDSPATTSATIYKTQVKTTAGGATCQPNSLTSYITVMEIGA
jgi:hypothetical protein